MCGICGKAGSGMISEAAIRRMTDTLSRRGPDDEGIVLRPGVGLGHRRLSIIDLEHGRQPLSNEDGTVWTVFNGEIYNYQELRDELQASGHRFHTHSDTEILVHLYEEKGDRFVDSLRGMFALAIWDGTRRRLVLARDHLGQKPLYYTHDGEQLTFASEIKALLADSPRLARVNLAAFKEYLTIRVISGSHSMFQGVSKLPPAHLLVYQDGRVHVRRYWDLEYEPKFRHDDRELIDELDDRLAETIRYHLVSDVEVGAFLSGGLDSSLIVGMLSRRSSTPLKTFSVGVPYKRFSELPYARATSRHCRTEAFMEDMPPTVREVLPSVVWHLDEPSDALAPCMYYLARMARRHVKVVIGGDGGDELFGGYDRYYGNRYVQYYASLPAWLRRRVLARIIQALPEGFWYKSLSHRLRWIHELSFCGGGGRYARSLSYFYFPAGPTRDVFGPRLRAEPFDPDESIRRHFEKVHGRELIDRMLYADSIIRLPNHPVMILDRMTMAWGLEARSPFMDHRLAEFAARLPSSLKVRGRSLRYIQTRLARRYLPRKVLRRHKQGFSSALPYVLAEEFRSLFERILRNSALVEAGLLNGRPIRHMLAEHLQGHRDHGNRLWMLANAELWYRMHIDGQTIDDLRHLLEGAEAASAGVVLSPGAIAVSAIDSSQGKSRWTPGP